MITFKASVTTRVFESFNIFIVTNYSTTWRASDYHYRSCPRWLCRTKAWTSLNTTIEMTSLNLVRARQQQCSPHLTQQCGTRCDLGCWINARHGLSLPFVWRPHEQRPKPPCMMPSVNKQLPCSWCTSMEKATSRGRTPTKLTINIKTLDQQRQTELQERMAQRHLLTVYKTTWRVITSTNNDIRKITDNVHQFEKNQQGEAKEGLQTTL